MLELRVHTPCLMAVVTFIVQVLTHWAPFERAQEMHNMTGILCPLRIWTFHI